MRRLTSSSEMEKATAMSPMVYPCLASMTMSWWGVMPVWAVGALFVDFEPCGRPPVRPRGMWGSGIRSSAQMRDTVDRWTCAFSAISMHLMPLSLRCMMRRRV